MVRQQISPQAAVLLGMAAAAIGTVAMDALQYRRYRREGGQSAPIAWEFAEGLDDWEAAPVPARVGKRLAEGYLHRELPPSSARPMTNLMHWGYGLSWGALYGLIAGSRRPRIGLSGLVFGAGVMAFDYTVLPLGKFYKPVWQYDLKTIWKDLSAHLIYGFATALGFALLSWPGRR